MQAQKEAMMSDELMVQLRECPFCGGDALESVVYRDEPDGLHAVGVAVWCVACGASTETCGTKTEAVAAWNSRSVEDALRAERDAALAEAARLRAELDACAAERYALRATLDAVRSALDTHAPKDTDKEADHED